MTDVKTRTRTSRTPTWGTFARAAVAALLALAAPAVSFPVLCGQPRRCRAGSAPDVSPCFLCVVWLVWLGLRRAAWFLRLLQEMLVLWNIPEVPGRLMGDGRAVCP
jgi:hypothetical protein